MKVKSIWTMDNLNFHWTQRKIVWNIKNKNFHWPLTEVVCLYKFGSVLNFHNPMIVKHSHLTITGAWKSGHRLLRCDAKNRTLLVTIEGGLLFFFFFFPVFVSEFGQGGGLLITWQQAFCWLYQQFWLAYK